MPPLYARRVARGPLPPEVIAGDVVHQQTILVTNLLVKGAQHLTSHRILQLNAVSTAACGLGLLAGRGTLYVLFGLDAPTLLDVIAVGLLALPASGLSRGAASVRSAVRC